MDASSFAPKVFLILCAVIMAGWDLVACLNIPACFRQISKTLTFHLKLNVNLAIEPNCMTNDFRRKAMAVE